MPKISTKPELTEAQFQKALKRSGFGDAGAFFGTRRFSIDGFSDPVPGIYAGRFGSFQPRLTLKHLQSVAALKGARADTKKKLSAALEEEARRNPGIF